MRNDELTVSDYIAIFQRRWILFGVAFLAVALLGIVTAFVLPATFHSSGTILIEQQDVPEELVQSTVTNYADERIQIITQRVMTVDNVGDIVERHDLYADERGTSSPGALLELFRADTSLETLSAEVTAPSGRYTTTATIAFKVGFRGSSPETTQAVAREIAELYLKENIKNRTESATEATAFLSRRAEELKSELAGLEQDLATFKAQHGSSLPEFQRLNLDRLEATEREIAEVQQEIRSLRDSRDLLASELSLLSPFAAYESADGVLAADPRRVDQLQRDYISLSSRYGPSHPDLIRVRRELELLTGGNVAEDLSAIEEQLYSLRQQLQSGRQTYGEAHPEVTAIQRQITELESRRSQVLAASTRDIKPTNPLYIQKQGQLNSTSNQLTTAEQRLATLNQRRTEYEQRLELSPEVERNYAALTREHETKLAQFRDIQGKLETATLSKTLEIEQKGERFTLTNPPLLPTEPESPNRFAIVMLSLVLAFGAGVGLVVLAETLDTTVRSERDLVRLFDLEPVAALGYFESEGEARQRRIRYALLGTAAVGSVAVAMFVIQVAG